MPRKLVTIRGKNGDDFGNILGDILNGFSKSFKTFLQKVEGLLPDFQFHFAFLMDFFIFQREGLLPDLQNGIASLADFLRGLFGRTMRAI